MIIFCLLTSFLTSAQENNDYNTIPELKRLQSLNVSQIAGTFIIEVGYDRLKLKLDPPGSFKEDYSSCTERSSMAGTWILMGQKTVLTDTFGSRMYDVLQFRQSYILVLSEQKNDFIKQFKKTVRNTNADNDADFVQYVIDELQVLIYRKKIEETLK